METRILTLKEKEQRIKDSIRVIVDNATGYLVLDFTVTKAKWYGFVPGFGWLLISDLLQGKYFLREDVVFDVA
jgi:hypothetical protein